MRALSLIIGAASLAIGGVAFAKLKRNEVPEARFTGAAKSCVSLTQLRESRVRSDKVIDFRISGNKWYRNELPHKCSSLGFEERFSFETSLSQLCSTDIIHVLHSYGGRLQRGVGCGLGKFQPIEIVKR